MVAITIEENARNNQFQDKQEKKSIVEKIKIKTKEEIKCFLKQFITPKVYYFGLLVFVFNIVVLVISAKFFGFFKNSNNQSVIQDYKESLVSSIIYVCILGPIIEEILFRKILFGLIKKYSRILAYLISPTIFAFAHFQYNFEVLLAEINTFPFYYLAGLALTINYDYTGWLLSSMVGHILTNSGATILLFTGLFN